MGTAPFDESTPLVVVHCQSHHRNVRDIEQLSSASTGIDIGFIFSTLKLV